MTSENWRGTVRLIQAFGFAMIGGVWYVSSHVLAGFLKSSGNTEALETLPITVPPVYLTGLLMGSIMVLVVGGQIAKEPEVITDVWT